MSTATERPTIIKPDLNGIPAELREQPQWVVWKLTLRDGKWTKPPLCGRTGSLADSTDPATWATVDECLVRMQRFDGIGYVFSPDDSYCGVDLDKCRDPNTGEIEPWAREIIDALDSYCEVSPSGTGVHVIVKASKPEGRNRKGKIELYDSGRYFALTGAVVDGCRVTIEDRQDELDALHARIFSPQEPAPKKPTGAIPADDQQIIDKAMGARNGGKFKSLWAGDTSGHGDDDSAADLALCNLLAFYTGPDHSKIDRLFRQSGLMREKWEREDYRARTIGAAIEGRSEFYKWNGEANTARRTGYADPGKPQIDAGCHDLPTITTEAWAALEQSNKPPKLFLYGGNPARIEHHEYAKVRRLGEFPMRYELARAATWYRSEKKGDQWQQRDAMPPRDVVKDLLSTPPEGMPLPSLTRIVEAPVFAPDGSLVTQPGYHSAAQVFYAPSEGFTVPDVPEIPSAKQIVAAVTYVTSELIVDFPFIGESEQAHALAAFLLPYARDLIDGATPLHLFEAPAPGTGKTLLVDMLSFPATGRALPAMTEGKDEEEWRKRIFAKLRTGPSAVLIDNINRRLDASALASAITAYPQWEDRILGSSEIDRVPVRCVWFATGNNVGVSGEMARRIVRIRLDSKQDRPWLREGFRHPDLRSWVIQNRAKLVWAALTIIRHWIAQGRPEGQKAFGMFESWAKVMGGVLKAANITGFLGNLEEFYEAADEETNEWRDFISIWWEQHGGAPVLVKDLHNITTEVGILNLGDGNEQRQRTRLGQRIGRQRDRIYSIKTEANEALRVKVERAGTYRRAATWRLREN